MFFKGLVEMDGFPLHGSGLWFFFGRLDFRFFNRIIGCVWFLTGWEDKEIAFNPLILLFRIKELLTGSYSMTLDNFHE
jgi:hypothetical protein